MPLQMRAAGSTDLATPPKDSTSYLAQQQQQAALPRSAASVTSTSSSTDAVLVNMPDEQAPAAAKSSTNNTSNSSSSSSAAAVVQGLPPLPVDEGTHRANAQANIAIADDGSSTVMSFSTVSSNSSASTAQTIQDGEFVMLQQNSNTQQTNASSAANSQYSSQQQQMMIGGSQQLLAEAVAAGSRLSSKNSSAPNAPAPSPNPFLDTSDNNSQNKKQQDDDEDVDATKPQARPQHQHHHTQEQLHSAVKPSTNRPTDAAVLSRVVESRATHGLLDAQLEQRAERLDGEEEQERRRLQKLEATDRTKDSAVHSICAHLLEQEELARRVLALEQEQAREIAVMNRAEEHKVLKRKNSPANPAMLEKIKQSSGSFVTPAMEEERRRMLELAAAEDSNKPRRRSPRSSVSHIIDKAQESAQAVLPAVARAVNSVVGGGGEEAPKCSGDCMGASAGFHRVSCPLYKQP